MQDMAQGTKDEEERLVRLYMEITGVEESDARAVFMYVCSERIVCFCRRDNEGYPNGEFGPAGLDSRRVAFPDLAGSSAALTAASAA